MNKKKPDLRRIILIGWGIILLGFLVMLLSALTAWDEEIVPLFWLGVAVTVGGVAFQAVKLRCPKCGCPLAFRAKVLPHYCPECGGPLY